MVSERTRRLILNDETDIRVNAVHQSEGCLCIIATVYNDMPEGTRGGLVLSADQARAFAKDLLNAADELERL
jgi:hypothetical protein